MRDDVLPLVRNHQQGLLGNFQNTLPRHAMITIYKAFVYTPSILW